MKHRSTGGPITVSFSAYTLATRNNTVRLGGHISALQLLRPLHSDKVRLSVKNKLRRIVKKMWMFSSRLLYKNKDKRNI